MLQEDEWKLNWQRSSYYFIFLPIFTQRGSISAKIPTFFMCIDHFCLFFSCIFWGEGGVSIQLCFICHWFVLSFACDCEIHIVSCGSFPWLQLMFPLVSVRKEEDENRKEEEMDKEKDKGNSSQKETDKQKQQEQE